MQFNVQNVNDFEKEILESKLPVVVDFWAPWCAPCKMLGPAFEKIAREKTFEGKVVFAKLNVDEHGETAQRAGVMNIPCIVLFKNGEETDRIVGFSGETMLREKINNWITGE
ncbi:MAG: thioredoxin [Candidatus Aenigmarchaeota archaeon]|nr:thioredoxin [Candidatus Aenigmarchaeota archaeon]